METETRWPALRLLVNDVLMQVSHMAYLFFFFSWKKVTTNHLIQNERFGNSFFSELTWGRSTQMIDCSHHSQSQYLMYWQKRQKALLPYICRLCGEEEVPMAMWLSRTMPHLFCCHRKAKGDGRFLAYLLGMDHAKRGKLNFAIKIEIKIEWSPRVESSLGGLHNWKKNLL